jgi:predicted nucleic acid-binding protein
VEIVAVDHAAALDLAEATGLTAYDASYFWLTRALGVELVTNSQADADTTMRLRRTEVERPVPIASRPFATFVWPR